MRLGVNGTTDDNLRFSSRGEASSSMFMRVGVK